MAKKKKEEVQEVTQTQEENKSIEVSVEQVCAAILSTIGNTVNVPLANIVANYSNHTIKVDQQEDGSVTFELQELPKLEEEQSANTTVGE